MLMVIATGILVPYYIKSNNSEATAGQAIGSTLTFSAESLTASVSLSNLDKDGTFATSAANEQAKFSIATDNFTGYTLTMRTNDGNTLKSTDPTTNTDTFTSITSNISASTFSNSANTSYNNQWGILPNYYYSNNATIANTDTYLKVPATNESITLDVTSAKNAEAKNYTIGIGARADYTNKIDTYSNTFVLEYIANPVTYSITYNANAGSDTVTNMPTTNPQTGSTSAGEAVSIPLYTNIPERTGYSFKGWCSVSTSDDTCSGTIYNDQTVEAGNRIMNYGIDQTIDNTMVTLNAMWTRNNATYSLTLDANGGTNAPTINNIINNTGSATFTLPTTIPTYEGYNFLGWCSVATSDNTCSGTTYSYDESTTSFNPSTITLTQTNLATSTISSTLYAIWELAAKTDISQLETMQDFASLSGQEYVAVLSSMTEGQSYQLKDSRDDKTYNIAKLKGGNVWLQDNLQLDIAAASANITSATTNANNDVLTCLKSGCSSSTTYSQAAAANTIASNWTDNGTYNRYTQAMYNMDNASFNASYGNGTHKSGYHYNYCAASAGSYCYASGSAPSNTNATQDICPAGWQMLAGDSSTYSYQKLYEAYGSNAVNFKNALHAGLSGYFNDNIYNQGTYGNFWASTYNSTDSMRSLLVNASSVSLQSSNNRNVGLSVRCVLKLPAMQDVNSDILATLLPENGNTTTLVDNRDGTEYTIGKLADGNYWMLDNLALDPSAQELSSSNTNVASKVTTTFENKTSGWNNTSPNNAYERAYFNLASKDISVQYGNNNKIVTKVGGYYNYCAASAGTYCYAINASPDNTNATSDICPAGWKMPNGDQAKGSYYYLFNTGYSGNKDNFRNALHAGYSGYFWDSSADYQGYSGRGYFWSTTRYNGNYMYHLLLVYTSGVYPQDGSNRYNGYSVRCVKK
ncbi:InlB B-repeat-containing protein [Candidatus Saccharibacteria bacterium]|nr:InlB B-repeat-containing protein [Candidatus Saccharibacteria bacterium]